MFTNFGTGSSKSFISWEGKMPELNLEEKYRVMQAVADVQRLLTLDELWTQYLANASSIPIEDVEILQSLTEEMIMLLTAIAQEFQALQNLVAPQLPELEETFAKTLDESPLAPDKSLRAQAQVQSRGGLAAVTEVAMGEVIVRAPREQEELRDKMFRIANGEFTPGDLTIRCALLAAGMGLAAGAGDQ
jgi:hypothetical protein